MIGALIGVGVTILLAGAGVIFAYGRNVQALTSLTKDVERARGENELEFRGVRETLSRFGERVGRLEARDEVEREFSGRVRGSNER